MLGPAQDQVRARVGRALGSWLWLSLVLGFRVRVRVTVGLRVRGREEIGKTRSPSPNPYLVVPERGEVVKERLQRPHLVRGSS